MEHQNVPDRDLEISRFVRERRKANRLTQAGLGELAEVGRRLIVDLEKGKPTLRMDAVNAVLSVFGKKLGVVEAPRQEMKGSE
jgi:y4mF family transcriptional regulator